MRPPTPLPGQGHREAGLERVNQRLNDLTQRLDRIAHAKPTTPPPVNGASAVDAAVAEIVARQRMLQRGMAPSIPAPPNLAPQPAVEPPVLQSAAQATAPSAEMLARAPTQDMSSLEHHFRRINEQIESLKRPTAVDNAILGLRSELAEIRRALQDALPRHVLDSLESELKSLSQRIDQSRSNGGDGTTLAGLERGLAEVRDALRALTPAEHLVGMDAAVQTLSDKIDVLASRDPMSFQQLESAVNGLRGIVSHVASNDTLAKLTEEVHSLAARIDMVANSADSGADVLSNLEQRIAALANAMEARGQVGGAGQTDVDAVVRGVTEQIGHMQLSRGDQMAVSHLEDRIAQLVEKLDASDARLNHLEAIERGLADVLVYLEQQRAQGQAGVAVPPAAVAAASGHAQPADERAQDALDALHGALDHVADRLAKIESGIPGPGAEPAAPPVNEARTETRTVEPELIGPPSTPAEPKQFPSLPSERLAVAAAAYPPVPATEAGSTAVSATAARRRPIDPSLPPDHPLEPGSAGPRAHADTPADRIAASEAALRSVTPPVAAEPQGTESFIAAARRAAQAAQAANQDTPARGRGRGVGTDEDANDKPTGSLAKRVRSIFVSLAAVLLLGGSLYLAAPYLPLGDLVDGVTEAPPQDVSITGATDRSTPAETPAPPPTAAVPAPKTAEQGVTPPLMFPPPANLAPTIALPGPAAPTGAIAPAPARSTPPDVTGSVPDEKLEPSAPEQADTVHAPVLPPPRPGHDETGQLPAALGSAALRAAAVHGDPAAQYEVALRYAEGRRVAQNLSEAATWFERASKQGLIPAKFRLGGLYEKGLGVTKNLDTARALYTAAAEGGNAKAMHNLAVLYAEGIGGQPDYRTAAIWFRRAAQHGVADSQYNLGILYARGIGVQKNLSESYKWFALAANDGDADAARKRDDVAARLDSATLMAAKLSAQTFTPDPEPPAAVSVATPPGGWDAARNEPAPRSIAPDVSKMISSPSTQ